MEDLDAHLAAVLDPVSMTATGHDDLLAVAQELIAEEGLRYFTNRLEELNLPGVPDNHRARLSEAAYKIAEHRPLGEIYNLIWRATRAAAEATQKNPHAPRAHMSTHALNQFESHAQRAVDDPAWEIKPFSEISGHGPTAMTRTLFYTVLDSNPIETSLHQLRDALPAPVPATIQSTPAAAPDDHGDDELKALIRWLNARPNSWNAEDVPAALSILSEQREDTPEWHFEGKILARGAGHLHRVYERLAPTIGSRPAALAVLAATALLLHPVTDNGTSLSSGGWILRQLTTILLGSTDEDTPDHDA